MVVPRLRSVHGGTATRHRADRRSRPGRVLRAAPARRARQTVHPPWALADSRAEVPQHQFAIAVGAEALPQQMQQVQQLIGGKFAIVPALQEFLDGSVERSVVEQIERGTEAKKLRMKKVQNGTA